MEGKGDAAKKIFEFDSDKSGTMDSIEFYKILEAGYRKLDREQFD